ncbi:hypothetical protein SRABI83_00933 [Arthrobacter sp. Bi83]|nr:hypothetical protein SRABI83_00933 [Arthrobacter sp. Bi83]
MLIRSLMPSTTLGPGAAMNATMPITAEDASETIEYARFRPWNPAATKHIAAAMRASWMLVARICMGMEQRPPASAGRGRP